ncbi:hypothetical protein F383_31796 [Gossypium arboreum]|uniref:Uncharacterized protein n=1 Tax=Gossypium arboreum TaxID=29729 RepID=A0A0B0PMK5_GOSAR|nr:hypothetical protein F383_31796 [Gossypium arboreum]
MYIPGPSRNNSFLFSSLTYPINHSE